MLAADLAARVQIAHGRDGDRAQLQAAGVAIIRSTTVPDLTALVDARKQSRAQLDLEVGVARSIVETGVEHFTDVDIAGTAGGHALTVQGPS